MSVGETCGHRLVNGLPGDLGPHDRVQVLRQSLPKRAKLWFFPFDFFEGLAGDLSPFQHEHASISFYSFKVIPSYFCSY